LAQRRDTMKRLGYETNIGGKTYYIPTRMLPGLERYINHGSTPGGFLVAVLSNNLKEAIWRADDENIENLPAYINYMTYEAPSGCWGSLEAMNAWIKKGGLEGKND